MPDFQDNPYLALSCPSMPTNNIPIISWPAYSTTAINGLAGNPRSL